jgi:thymidine kinase
MAKLFFRYGTMNSGKSLDLLKVCYNYEENNLTPIIFTSIIDDRYGTNLIKSRTGLQREAISIKSGDNIFDYVYKLDTKPDVILIDEVQFLDKEHIYQLSEIVDLLNIPVICYGLRGDFKGEPFLASSILMTIADTLEEIKTICSVCKTKKSIMNAKFKNDKLVTTGKQIDIGGNDKYKPLCRKCYNNLKIK